VGDHSKRGEDEGEEQRERWHRAEQIAIEQLRLCAQLVPPFGLLVRGRVAVDGQMVDPGADVTSGRPSRTRYCVRPSPNWTDDGPDDQPSCEIQAGTRTRFHVLMFSCHC
jgi:hypothetical protein